MARDANTESRLADVAGEISEFGAASLLHPCLNWKIYSYLRVFSSKI